MATGAHGGSVFDTSVDAGRACVEGAVFDVPPVGEGTSDPDPPTETPPVPVDPRPVDEPDEPVPPPNPPVGAPKEGMGGDWVKFAVSSAPAKNAVCWLVAKKNPGATMVRMLPSFAAWT